MIDAVVAYFLATSGLNTLILISIKSTAVLLLGLLLWMLLNKASASARHLTLCTTLFAAALVPLISLLMPALPITVDPVTVANTKQANERALLLPATNSASNPSMQLSPMPSSQSAATSNDRALRLEKSVNSIRVERSIVFVVASLSLAIFLQLALGVYRLRQISRRAYEIKPQSDWYALLPDAQKGRTRLRKTKLLLSREISAPLTWGFHKPVIILPSYAEHWNSQDRQSALLHEASHIERHDWFFQISGRLICALYWFNPLVWIVNQKLILEAERAADDRVLLAGNAASDYAQQLIALTKNSGHKGLVPLPATSMAAKNLLPFRVRSILNKGVNRMPLRTLSKFMVFTVITSFTLVIGSTHLVAATNQTIEDLAALGYDKSTTTLIHAAAIGDHAEVQRLLSTGSDVNDVATGRSSSKWYQRTALTTAAKSGHLDIVTTLLDAGAPVDRIVTGDATALIEALNENHANVVRLLIARGADVGLTVVGDGSPLIAASRANNSEMVDLLLNHSANPNDSVPGDGSVLFHAAKNGNLDIVQRLIAAGVDVNQKLPGDGNALIIAANHRHKEVVRALINAGARADDGVPGDGNAMITAAAKGDVDSLSLMIATGADVNAGIQRDGSPLIVAARNGHMDAVTLLLDHGADIDKVVRGDENALIGAAWAGNMPMVEYLLERGADPNIKAPIRGGQYRSALSQARVGGHNDVILALQAAGARD